MVTTKNAYQIPKLPLPIDLESKAVLKKTKEASRALGELKGVAVSMPNQNILISTLSLQEAKDSSAIENIVTTQDELYQSDALTQQYASQAAKEVHLYASAIRDGFEVVKESSLITNNLLKKVQAEIKGNNAGFRTKPGTVIKNDQTGEVIYSPPQQLAQIEEDMKNLECFINDDEICDWDPLVKMAVIHHQFESIHPFPDGNGRTGRILNILYLVKEGLLDTPILYLSRYINQNKSEYYRLLQAVRDQGQWEEWVLYILEGVTQTAYQTIGLVEEIKAMMLSFKHKMREETKYYSQDLLNLLFCHPYTKIDFLEKELKVHRNTATKYLNGLVDIGLLHKEKIGKSVYYLNPPLVGLFLKVGTQPLMKGASNE